MPKETITDPGKTHLYKGFVTDEPATSDTAADPDHVQVEAPKLEVNWMRPSDVGDGWVQVSMQLDAKHVHELAARADETIVATWVYTDVLTRQQINNMIRVLRRARDAAYGSDE